MSERWKSLRLTRVGWARWLASLALALLVGIGVGRCGASQRAGGDAEPAETAAQQSAEVWTCSMHPQIRQPGPGQCPICGMDLIPVSNERDQAPAPNRIVLSERAKVLARLRTSEVQRWPDPSTELRLLGRVEPDETSARSVTAWVGGRIERLHVRVTGARVRAGQVIATIYSPEALTAHQDLLAAARQLERLEQAGDLAREAARAALAAARERLRLLGIRGEQLDELERQREPLRSVSIHSPFGGTVIERLATEGAYVTVGEPLYRVADLARVWVQLDAYERDLRFLKVGQQVSVQIEALPGEALEGRVAFIDPTLDPRRRTAQVRVELDNPNRELLPGMFAQAVVQGQAAQLGEAPLVVPDTAPLFTGLRSIVYVELPGAERPTYEAREVRLGPRAGALYPVVSGLRAGERVVTRGAFVLDADLQIRGGASMMMRPELEQQQERPVLTLTSSQRAMLRPVLEAYLQLQHALSLDERADAAEAARALRRALREVQFERGSPARGAWEPLSDALQAASWQIAEAESLERMRGKFELLSINIVNLVRTLGNPLEHPVALAHCPMASGEGIWLQRVASIENPYFGHAMRTCGEIRDQVGAREHLPASEAEPVVPGAAQREHAH